MPEDVAVSGFDNNIEDLLAENLTTVQVFNEELGSRLALQILYRIKYPHTPHEVTYLGIQSSVPRFHRRLMHPFFDFAF